MKDFFKKIDELLNIDDKAFQNRVIFEFLFTNKFFIGYQQTVFSGTYLFILTDYWEQIRADDEQMAFQMMRLFRQLFLNEHLIAVKVKNTHPLEVRFMFALDYPKLNKEEKNLFEPVPAKLLFMGQHKN
jgi:hypothetical protein